MIKTNVVRILEAKEIKHTVLIYKFSKNVIDAISVAEKIEAEQENVFKTLLAKGNMKVIYSFLINYDNIAQLLFTLLLI